MKKKFRIIGVAVAVAVVAVIAFSGIALADDGGTDIDVDGGALDGVTVTAGSDDGHLFVHVYQHTSPAVGSHHWFTADGGFDATVSVTPGPSGSGLMRTDMHGTSRSPATFTGGGAQNFDVTASWPNNTWGMIQYCVTGSDSAELNTAIGTGGGGTGFHRTINGSYYTLMTASGTYDAYVEAWLIDSTAVSFDNPFNPGTSDVIAGGWIEFWNSSPGSVIWDDTFPQHTGITSDIHGISIPDTNSWDLVGSGFLEMEGWGAGGMSNWNGQSIPGPNAYAWQLIYHGGDWQYNAGISAED